jgi:crossover junction endodeoxyribonuclease RuvC
MVFRRSGDAPQMKYLAGIDPGLHGAIALLDEHGAVQVYDMPTHKITVNDKGRHQIDLYALARLLDMHGPDIRMAYIEEVHAMPAQGVSSSFSFGFAAGAVQAMVASAFVRMHLVSPAKWKRAMGLTADKDASRRMASRLLPCFSHLWARALDDGRAEAALLAVYGSRLP